MNLRIIAVTPMKDERAELKIIFIDVIPKSITRRLQFLTFKSDILSLGSHSVAYDQLLVLDLFAIAIVE